MTIHHSVVQLPLNGMPTLFSSLQPLGRLLLSLKAKLFMMLHSYGGISIVFSGDFHQLRPVRCESHGVLYEGILNGLFEGSINTAVILEDSHRFDEDLAYGELLTHFWNGEVTLEDIEMLNTRVVGQNGVTLPDDDSIDADTCYACPFNKQRNASSAGIFQEHLRSGLFPSIDSDDLPPDHTIIIEADIQSHTSDDKTGKTRVSREMRDRIISTCGDSHVVNGQNKKMIRVCGCIQAPMQCVTKIPGRRQRILATAHYVV